MKTFILMWNPAISSFGYKAFKNFFKEPVGTDMNWSVWDWKEASAGDRFFMVRVGEEGIHGKGNGIVMSGHFTSDPYRGTDWSGKGREVYYADLQPDYIFDTEKVQSLTDDSLMKVFPQFDWTKGHSGQLIDATLATSLELEWTKCILSNQSLLSNGRNWRIARDVFKYSPTVELFREHFRDELKCVDAVFYGGGLDVYKYSDNYYLDQGSEFLPEVPEGEYTTSVDDFSIEIESLRKAFGVKDNRAVAKRLREEYSGRDGMARLREFVQKSGCKIDENVIYID